MSRRRRLTGLSLCVAAGLVLALALPGPGLWPLVLLFPPLLLEGLDRFESPWQAAGAAVAAGTAHWCLATHWIADVLSGYGGLPTLAAVASVLGMGLILGALWAPVGLAAALCAPGVRIWVVPAVWIVMETVRRFQPFAFPWNTTAASLASVPALLQSLAVWGAGGLGWALVVLGCGLWGLARRPTRRWGAVAGGAALLAIAASSLLAPAPKPSRESLRVAIVQPGTTLEERWNPDAWPVMVDRVWRLTADAAETSPDLVLWPESAIPFRWDSDAAYRQQVRSLAASADAAILLNSVGELEVGWTNSAYAVAPDGEVTRYDKVRLVPFGEYVPAWARFFFPDALVQEVGGFTPGTAVRPIRAQVPVGMAVCYEIVFPGLAAEQVRSGAEVLATLTNDAWYGDSWALRQHFAHAALRAVETRRYVVRSALTGISGIVDPYGRVRERLEVNRSGILVGEIRPMSGITPRTRFGEWSLLLAVAAAALAVASGRRRQ